MSRRARLLLVVLVGALAAACSGATAEPSPTLRVLAAASLHDVAVALGELVTQEHPGAVVEVVADGSNRLATQLLDGASAGVFLSADDAQMRRVAGLLAGEPRAVARSRLALVVGPGNPLGVTGVTDLARPDRTVVLAAPEVPAGAYTARMLTRAGVEVRPASLETSVRGVLAKVALGEADLGVVYASDLAYRDDVDGVAIPEDVNVTTTALAGLLADAAEPALARAFVDVATSPAGQAAVRAAGFTAVGP